MPDAMLSWQQAGVLTAVLLVVTIGATLAGDARLRAVAPFAREATLIAGLYALWQLAGELSVLGTTGALSRARWIEHTEQAWHLPSEASVQRALTGNAVVAQAANIYYATMHFGVLFVFLVWLFVRHRDDYPRVRRVLVLTTFACLLVQLVPVAPPRMLPGFVDTAQRYGQSVYSLGFGADQLSAMPSVHVAWAVLVAWTVLRLGSGPGRWLGVVHAVVTVLVVVATANHFWADGVVAVAILAACAALERGGSAVLARLQPIRTERAELSPAVDARILR